MGHLVTSALRLITLLALVQGSNGCPATTDTCQGLLVQGVSMYKTAKRLGGGCREKCSSSVLSSLAEIGGWKCGRCPGTAQVFISDIAFFEMTLSPLDGILEGTVYNAWENATKAHFVELNTDIEVLEIEITDVVQLISNTTARRFERSLEIDKPRQQVTIRSAVSVVYSPKTQPSEKPEKPFKFDEKLGVRVDTTYVKDPGKTKYTEKLNKEYGNVVAVSQPRLTVEKPKPWFPTKSCPIQAPTPSPVKPPTPSPVKPPTLSPVKPPTPSPVKPPTLSPVKPPTPSPVKPPTPSPLPLPNVVINELMVNPFGADDLQEWFELYNAGSGPVNLTDWIISDETETNAFGIYTNLVVPAGGYILVAPTANTDVNGGISPNVTYSYGSGKGKFQLLNSVGSIVLYNADSTIIDRMRYNQSFPGVTTPGRSIQLRSPTLDNTFNVTNWCLGISPYGSTANLGSPGRVNVCSAPAPAPIPTIVVLEKDP